jgi:subtilisin family serine protease
VGAVGEDREIAPFSTHNSEVDVSAPGVDVLSLVHTCSTCYSLFSGTSMASPHVAGVFALLMSKYPSKSISEIREAIQESAVDSGACGIDRMFGHGIVDAVAAADYLEKGASASEQSGCKNTKVTVRTDKWGSEISYVIRNSAGDIVYKNGPYTNQIKTYTDDIQLPDDCYEFELVDSYGMFGHCACHFLHHAVSDLSSCLLQVTEFVAKKDRDSSKSSMTAMRKYTTTLL